MVRDLYSIYKVKSLNLIAINIPKKRIIIFSLNVKMVQIRRISPYSSLSLGV